MPEQRRRTPLWQSLALTAGLALGVGGPLAFMVNQPARPGRNQLPSAVQALEEGKAERIANGQKDPEALVRLAGLEVLRDQTDNPAHKEALDNQILLEAYAAIRSGALPENYRDKVLATLESAYNTLMLRQRLTEAGKSVAETVDSAVDTVNAQTGAKLPGPDITAIRGQLNELKELKDTPENFMRAVGHVATDTHHQAHIDRKMETARAVNSQILEAFTVIEKLESMAAKGPLTVTGPQPVINGMIANPRSYNSRDFGTPHSSHNQSQSNRTGNVGAVRVTNGVETIDVVVTKPSLAVGLPAALAHLSHGNLQVATPDQQQELQTIADDAHKAANPGSPSR